MHLDLSNVKALEPTLREAAPHLSPELSETVIGWCHTLSDLPGDLETTELATEETRRLGKELMQIATALMGASRPACFPPPEPGISESNRFEMVVGKGARQARDEGLRTFAASQGLESAFFSGSGELLGIVRNVVLEENSDDR